MVDQGAAEVERILRVRPRDYLQILGLPAGSSLPSRQVSTLKMRFGQSIGAPCSEVIYENMKVSATVDPEERHAVLHW